MAENAEEAKTESDVTPSESEEGKLGFDNDTLRAIVEVYKEDGNASYRKRDYYNAVNFYTEGINVKCKDDELNAKLYSNRATANFYLGKYQETIDDAKAAIDLQPTYIKAIERGASACEKLGRREEAIKWCDRGLAINKQNKALLDLKTSINKPQEKIVSSFPGDVGEFTGPVSVGGFSGGAGFPGTVGSGVFPAEYVTGRITQHRTHFVPLAKQPGNIIELLQNGLCLPQELGHRTDQGSTYGNLGNAYQSIADFQQAIQYNHKHLQISIDFGDRAGEGRAYGNLGNAYQSLGDFYTAIQYHQKTLQIAKDLGDRAGEGRAYGNLGNAYQSLGDFQQAIHYHQKRLQIAKDLGDCAGEGRAYDNLSNAYQSLGDFKQAIQYHQKRLQIAKDLGDLVGEGRAYGNLGNAYQSHGDFQKAMQYHQKRLQIALDLGDRAGEGGASSNLGNTFQSLGDFNQAIQYHQKHLQIAKDLGDRAGEGRAFGNLGNAYQSLGDFLHAIHYHQKRLQIAKDLVDRVGEGRAYGNLGNAYQSLGDFKQAIQYHQIHLQIAKDLGDRAGEGRAYSNLGNAYQLLGDFQQAIQYHKKSLQIAKDLSDRAGEGGAYGNLGNAYQSLGDFNQAIQYHQKDLQISKDLGDRAAEGGTYGNLGNAYQLLGDFKQAIQYNQKYSQIAIDLGDRAGEGRAYGNLGNAYQLLGDLQQAIQYHQKSLQIAKDLGDRAGEGDAYGNLGNAYQSLGDFNRAIQYHQKDLQISKDLGARAAEGGAYGNLGNTFQSLGDFNQAIQYHQKYLQIAKDLGDRAGEGRAYGNLGNAYQSLGDLQQAIQYHHKNLQIAKDLGERTGEGCAYGNLGNAYQSLGGFQQAVDCYQKGLQIFKDVGSKVHEASSHHSLGCVFQSLALFSEAVDSYRSSVTLLDTIRALLHSEDSWKRSFRELYHKTYTALWRCLLKIRKNDEALCAAEQGRAQALIDMLMMQYGLTGLLPPSCDGRDLISYISRMSHTQTVFLATEKNRINIWVLGKGNEVVFRKGEIESQPALEDPVRTLLETVFEKIGAGVGVRCENRTIDELNRDPPSTRKEKNVTAESAYCTNNALRPLYDVVIGPIADVLHADELVIVPDGSFWLAPWAALSEDIRIRTVPSLTSLKLITSSPKDFHSKSGALLVGDPWVQELAKSLPPLPYAKKEVEMIGEILKTPPLTGKEATKAEVLKRMTSVGLVHIAAHGRKETGEIALAPNPGWTSEFPEEKEFMMNISDVQAVHLRASLVVLSCCHSGRGEVLKSEGVVGLARAFLCAGARSVLVALWAIDDDATMEFMKSFYQQLREGKSTSIALHLAMKSLRDSENFSAMRHWAPFLLIGDDVTLEFDGKK